MRYTVALTPVAEQFLANAWLASSDRPAVTAAMHQLEQELAADPLQCGESRGSSVSRVRLLPPLGISFDVVVDDTAVYITAVWLIE
jgi:hypothetical protein